MNKKRIFVLSIFIILITGLVTFSFAGGDEEVYEVKFISSNGQELKIQKSKNSKIEKPEDPILENYTFLGWFTEEDVLFDFDSKVTEDIVLTAKWAKAGDTLEYVNYIVKHYLMNINGEYNNYPSNTDTYIELDGMDVIGSVRNYNGYDTPNVKSIKISKDRDNIIEYYYPLKRYSVNILGDNGVYNIYGNGNYYYGTRVTLGYQIKDGYTLNYVSDNVVNNQIIVGSSNNVTISTKPNENTLYTVKHYLMDINGEYSKDATLEEKLYGTTDSNVLVPVKVFKGFKSPTEKEVVINGNGQAVLEYFYEREKYKLEIEKSEGIENVEGVGEYYFESLVNLNVSLMDGYEFDGWSFGNGDENTSIKITEDTKVKVNAKLISYNIKYEIDDDVINNNPDTYTVKDEINLNEPIKDGYIFKGWKEIPSNVITKGTTGDIKLTPIWEGKTNVPYKVQYVDRNNNSDNVFFEETFYGISGSEVTPVIKDFEGYSKASTEEITININGDGSSVIKYYYFRKSYNVNFKVDINNDNERVWKTDETGNYVEVNGKRVSIFNSYGNDVVMFGESLDNLRTPEAKGYEFAGWYLDEELTIKAPNTMPSNEITLYSKWMPSKTTYNIRYRFMNKDGKYDESLDVVEGPFEADTDTVVTVNPTREFEGFKTPTYSSSVVASGNGKSEILFQYARNRYNINVDTYLGENKIDKDASYKPIIVFNNLSLTPYYENDITIKLKIVLNPGYQYDRFEIDKSVDDDLINEYDEEGYHYIEIQYKVLSDINIKVIAKRIEHTITYIDAGDNPNPDKYYYGENVVFEKPSKAGYNFLYWLTEDGKSIYNTQGYNKDLVLTAKWSKAAVSYIVNHYIMNPDGEYELLQEIKTTTSEVLEVPTKGAPTVSTTRFIIPEKQTVQINQDGSTVVNYYYDRKTVEIRFYGLKGGVKLDTVYRYTDQKIGELPDAPDIPGYKFIAWHVNSSTGAVYDKDASMGTGNKNMFAVYEEVNTTYKVRYRYMDVNGNWDESKTYEEEFTARVGSTQRIVPVSVTGYKKPSTVSKVIEEDGSTVFEINYERSKYKVYINKDAGIQSVEGAGEYYYGQTVTVNATLKDGYTFDDWAISNVNQNINSNTYTFTIEKTTVLKAISKPIE